MKTTHQDLLPGKSIGVITRVFAHAEKDVKQRVSMTVHLLEQIFTLEMAHKVQVLIPMNPAFADYCDCGFTRQALVKALHGKLWAGKVAVTASTRCHPGSLLNYGVAALSTDWVWVVSPECINGVLEHQDVLSEISRAAKESASVVGFQFSDLEETTALGIVPGRCAFWRRIPLMEAGGFLSLFDFTLRQRTKKLLGDSKCIPSNEEGLTILRMLETSPGIRTAILRPIRYQPPPEPSAQDRLARIAENKTRSLVTMVKELGGDMSRLRSSLISI